MITLRDLWPRFQGHGINEGEYLKNGACYGQSFYRTLIGNHTRCKRVARVCQHQVSFLLPLWSRAILRTSYWVFFYPAFNSNRFGRLAASPTLFSENFLQTSVARNMSLPSFADFRIELLFHNGRSVEHKKQNNWKRNLKKIRAGGGCLRRKLTQ